jgi:hypothetical protein
MADLTRTLVEVRDGLRAFKADVRQAWPVPVNGSDPLAIPFKEARAKLGLRQSRLRELVKEGVLESRGRRILVASIRRYTEASNK